ncbi:MAG: transglycosylase SLT domain-containing protein [Deltaproteobacteria bacterium]|nr:transglycosylase SLT domain-containing protein [Deltaproteobacteria bacterium]
MVAFAVIAVLPFAAGLPLVRSTSLAPIRERAIPLAGSGDTAGSSFDLRFPTTRVFHRAEAPVVVDRRTIERIARTLIPLTHNEVSEAYLAHFMGKGKGTMKAWLRRAGRYLRLFERELAREGLPRELIWLAAMESGFRNNVTSWAGARGLWQFMPKTGARYALRQTDWIDERRDPEKATRAAARHLKDLYNEFRDWHLALAAYNTGAGYVNAGIRKHGTRDFFELRRKRHWARETGNYVPKFIAVTRLAETRAKYIEFRNLVVPEAENWRRVELDRAIDLRRLARAAGVSFDTLRELNPELTHWCTPPTSGYKLRVPASKLAAVDDAVERLIAKSPERFVVHHVKRGERLTKIAARYKVPARVVAARNDLRAGARLRVHARLVIPIPAAHETTIAMRE